MCMVLWMCNTLKINQVFVFLFFTFNAALMIRDVMSFLFYYLLQTAATLSYCNHISADFFVTVTVSIIIVKRQNINPKIFITSAFQMTMMCGIWLLKYMKSFVLALLSLKWSFLFIFVVVVAVGKLLLKHFPKGKSHFSLQKLSEL